MMYQSRCCPLSKTKIRLKLSSANILFICLNTCWQTNTQRNSASVPQAFVWRVTWLASLPLSFARCLHLTPLPSLAFWALLLLLSIYPPSPLSDVLARWRKITFCSCRSWKGIGPETSPGIKASCFVSPPLHSTGESSSSSSSSTFLYFHLCFPPAWHPPARILRLEASLKKNMWVKMRLCPFYFGTFYFFFF